MTNKRIFISGVAVGCILLSIFVLSEISIHSGVARRNIPASSSTSLPQVATPLPTSRDFNAIEPQIVPLVGETPPQDHTVMAAQKSLRGYFALDADDHVELRGSSGNFYSFSAYPTEGGGGFWAVAKMEGNRIQIVISGQDYPFCSSAALLSVPLELLPYCYTEGDYPELVNRFRGTTATP